MSALFVMDAPSAPFPLNVMPPTSTSPDTVTVQPSSANTAVEPGIQAVVPPFQLRLVASHVPSPPLHVSVSAGRVAPAATAARNPTTFNVCFMDVLLVTCLKLYLKITIVTLPENHDRAVGGDGEDARGGAYVHVRLEVLRQRHRRVKCRRRERRGRGRVD